MLVPIIFVGLVLILAAAVVVWVPIIRCPFCEMVRISSIRAGAPDPTLQTKKGNCEICHRRGRITILRRYIEKPENLDSYIQLQKLLEPAQ